MAQDSKIEWTHHTANLWHGCTKVHAGCDHCYAETLSKRWGNDIWGNDKPRKEIKSVWKDLARYQKLALAAGEVHRVFVGSMMDIFEKPMMAMSINGESGWINTGQIRDRLFKEISEGKYPNLMFLLLTKRPSNINKYIPEAWKENPPLNVMFGCSPVNQETYNKMVPELLKVNGKRFLSIEPQLGKIEPFYPSESPSLANQSEWVEKMSKSLTNIIHWIIVGGESGHGRRPFDPEWARIIKSQCETMNVPFFMKQIDKIIPIPEDLMVRQFPVEGWYFKEQLEAFHKFNGIK